MTVIGCHERRPRAPEEEHAERGDHLCGYIAGHKGEHACACASPRKKVADVIAGRWSGSSK